jgi:hypothetical protein
MMEDTKSNTGSGNPELPKDVLFQSLWRAGAMNTEISPEYCGTSIVLLRGGVFETMINSPGRAPNQISLWPGIPKCRNTCSIQVPCIPYRHSAGLLKRTSRPGISGPWNANV